MSSSIKTLASIFTLAAGICFGAGAYTLCRAGNTVNGLAFGVAGGISVASGAIGLKTRSL